MPELEVVCPKCGSSELEEVDLVYRYTPVETWEEGTDIDGKSKYPTGSTYGLSYVDESASDDLEYPYWCAGCEEELTEVVFKEGP